MTVDPTADSTLEADENIIATVTAGTGYTAAGSAATGTITNDDTDVTLAISPSSVGEDGVPNLVYTFTRAGVTAGELTVNFTVGGTAAFGTDYTQTGAASFNATTGTVTFAAGSATATVTLDPSVDTVVEANETTLLTLTAGSYNIATAGAVTGTIDNDDTDVSVAVTPPSVTEDGAGVLVYTFTRAGVTAVALTVNFSVGGTATFGSDYAQSGATAFAATTGRVAFSAGAATATVTLDPAVDSTTETDEMAILTVVAGAGYNATGSAATGSIVNDDSTVSVAVSPSSLVEDGTQDIIYTFTPTGLLTNALTVDFAVAGSATFGTDYAQTGAATFSTNAGTVTFEIGSPTATVNPTADTTAENDEAAVLTLAASGVGYTTTGPGATGTILNYDTVVTLALTPGATTSESTLTALTYTFSRTGDSSAALVVNFTRGGTAALGSDYTLTSAAVLNTALGTISIPAGSPTATMTFTPINDSAVEGNETGAFTVATGSGYGIGTAGAVVATIADNDAELSITKTNGVPTSVPGLGTTYTIVVSNPGLTDIVGATVADTFPAALSGVTWTAVGAGGGTATTTGAGNINDTVNLPSGGSVTFTVTGTIGAAATGTLANTATVTVPAGFTDVIPGNNSATDTDTLTPQGDLAITKTNGVSSVIPGTNSTYTITVSNAGPSNIVGATVADTFPASFGNVTWTAVGAGGGAGAAAGSGNISELVNLPAGGSLTFTVTGTVNSAATGTLVNTATVSAPGGSTDPTPGNNSASDFDTLTPQADLVVLKTGPTTVIAGTDIAYNITVTNNGPSDATSVSFEDILPPNTTFVSVNQTGPIVGGVFPVGGTQTVTFVVHFSAAAIAGATLSNTASFSTVTTDPTPGNNSSTTEATIRTRADLSLTKTGSPDPVFVGNNLTYSLAFANNGASNAQNATITDVIPAGMTFVSATGTAMRIDSN